MVRILFVCHGNICRSVSAEYIMKYLIMEKSVGNVEIYIDSAATSMEEIGNQIYIPMKKTLESHKIPIGNHCARRVDKSEYNDFDFIIAMDEENMYNLTRLFDGDPEKKVHYLMEYTDTKNAVIEDPWYTRKFEKVFQSILKGCIGLLEYIEDSRA